MSDNAAPEPAEPSRTPQGCSPTIARFAKAMAQAQRAMISPYRNREVAVKSDKGSYKFRYTTLDAINEMIRGPLTENGFTMPMHQVVQSQRGQLLVTTIFHESGEWMSTQMPLGADSGKPQAFGSAMTYAKRYNNSALLNIASDEDDDGGAAAGHQQTVTERGQPESLADRFRHLIAHAKSVGPLDVSAGIGLLRLWQKDMQAFTAMRDQPERKQGWTTLLDEMQPALDRAFGPIFAQAWMAGLLSTTQDEITALRGHWDDKWAAPLKDVQKRAPAAHGLLQEHLRFQADRVGSSTPPPEERRQSVADRHNEAKAGIEPTHSEQLDHPTHFPYPLFDETGAADDATFDTALEFAETLANLALTSSYPQALIEHNADALAACMADRDAAAALEGAGVAVMLQQSTIPVVPLTLSRSGAPDLGRYLTEVKAALLTLSGEQIAKWEEFNAQIYDQLPNGSRMAVLRAIVDRRAALRPHNG